MAARKRDPFALHGTRFCASAKEKVKTQWTADALFLNPLKGVGQLPGDETGVISVRRAGGAAPWTGLAQGGAGGMAGWECMGFGISMG